MCVYTYLVYAYIEENYIYYYVKVREKNFFYKKENYKNLI